MHLPYIYKYGDFSSDGQEPLYHVTTEPSSSRGFRQGKYRLPGRSKLNIHIPITTLQSLIPQEFYIS